MPSQDITLLLYRVISGRRDRVSAPLKHISRTERSPSSFFSETSTNVEISS